MSNSAILLVPMAQRVAANRYIAAMAGENVLLSENLTVPCSQSGIPDDNDPSGFRGATHVLGSAVNRSAEWLALYQNLATQVPAPPGGWPVMAAGNAVLTQAEAEAAAAAMVVSVLSQAGEWTTALTMANVHAMLGSLDLKLIVDTE